MLVYNTIFFAECQDGNGFLFHFINFAQTQVIFYSKLTSKNIPFLLSMCSCFQSGSLRRKLCSISQLITFTKNGQELLPYIQKSRRGHLHNGKSPRRYLFIGSGFSWWCPFQVTCLWNLFFAFCGKLLCYTPNTVFMVCSIKDRIACWLYPFSDALTI